MKRDQELEKMERLIKEERTIQATRHNLMGKTGKFGIIARFLGSAIYGPAGGGTISVDTNYLPDLYELPDEKEIRYASEDDGMELIGWIYDGMPAGLHVEIRYLDRDHEIRVQYKGYTVYKETNGDLDGYAPFPEWEQLIDRLYKRARERMDHLIKIGKVERLEEHQSWFKTQVQRLSMIWGKIS